MSLIESSLGLTTVVDDRNHLVGARCAACATHTFPVQSTCPSCGDSMIPVALPTSGTVWTWTVQRIAPKPPYRGPQTYEPFALGYVDVGPIRIESRLEGKDVDSWRIGDLVELEVGDTDEHGNHWQFCFRSAQAL